MNLYRRHAENSAHQHAEQKSPRMHKQTYSWAEVAGSIFTAIALWLFATLLIGATIGLAWAVARNIVRLLTG